MKYRTPRPLTAMLLGGVLLVHAPVRAQEEPARETEPASVDELVIDIHTHVLNSWDLPYVEFVRNNWPWLAGAASMLGSYIRDPETRLRGAPGTDDASGCLVDFRGTDQTPVLCSQEEANALASRLVKDNPALQEQFGVEVTRGPLNVPAQVTHLVQWVSSFGHPRTYLARELAGTYPRVHLFTPAMVDMDGWPGTDVELPSFEERLRALERTAETLNRRYPGLMHPFVAFNPRHGVAAYPEYIPNYHQIVERALLEGSFLGVKLYPSFGFFPLDNATIETDEEHRPAHAAQLDRELMWLYELAERHGIPVMTHCTAEGAELGEEYSEIYGHPENWRPVLERYPKLRISLGHFGKARQLLDAEDPSQNWPAIIAEMMESYPNLYADLALDETPTEERFSEMLHALRSLMETHPAVRTRLMYGSDWFMLVLIQEWKDYYDRYDRAFTTTLFGQETRRAFFGGTAVRFLGLQDSAVRERLMSYYRSRSLRPPRWLTPLDAN